MPKTRSRPSKVGAGVKGSAIVPAHQPGPIQSRIIPLLVGVAVAAAGLIFFIDKKSTTHRLPPAYETVLIKGGTFRMGADDGLPHERPAHDVTLRSFRMDKHEVTVARFRAFVEAAGYQTDADRWGWSGVFNTRSRKWDAVHGATWRHPLGPGSTAGDDEPVTQVSWNDATAFAKWAGMRLPTEAEFEYAARGGLVGKPFAWGDELRPNGRPVANWWQGTFPNNNTAEDGYPGVAPVGMFPPNGYGLHDMTGNVWEWCADFYADDYFSRSPKENPKGPASGTDRVIRGGSFLCAENFCSNFRVAGRSKNEAESANNNLGFRCVVDVPNSEQ